MVTNESWQTWYDENGCKFGQFIHVHEAVAIRDAAPESLRAADLNADAFAIGQYMRRWQESGGVLNAEAPRVPGDTFNDPLVEFSKIVGFLGA